MMKRAEAVLELAILEKGREMIDLLQLIEFVITATAIPFSAVAIIHNRAVAAGHLSLMLLLSAEERDANRGPR
jgi:hypothetical protein